MHQKKMTLQSFLQNNERYARKCLKIGLLILQEIAHEFVKFFAEKETRCSKMLL